MLRDPETQIYTRGRLARGGGGSQMRRSRRHKAESPVTGTAQGHPSRANLLLGGPQQDSSQLPLGEAAETVCSVSLKWRTKETWKKEAAEAEGSGPNSQ